MKQEIYVIFDLKSKTTASQLILSPNPMIVKRNLITYGNSISPSIKKFPEDFAVFHVGTYDDEKPSISGLDLADMEFSMKEVIDYVGIEENQNS